MSFPSGPTALLRQPAELLFAVMHHRRRTLARPIDRPWVRTGSGEALRFLFIGNGMAHGWGVSSHRLAPTGELARGLRAITGSACEVEFVGDAAMTAATAVTWLADRADTSFHGAVIEIGQSDAMRLTPVADWGARLIDLLDAVQSGLPAGAPVVLVGIPDVHVPGRVRPVGPLAVRHARRLDRVARRLAEVRPGVVFLPAPRLAAFAGRRPSTDLYSAFATPIAAVLASAVRDAHVAATGTVRAERFDRAEVRTIVEAARASDLAALQSIVERAAREFHVTEAMVSLLDGDRTWHVASTGTAPVAAPRSLTYCEVVVATDEPLVVEDAKRDERFSTNAFLGLVHAPFYAGVPIHAEDGTTIGALCLLNGSARAAESVDLERLRDFAHEAELVIRSATAAAGWLDAVPAI
ncbi:GAF domain-containing protein [uncultured Amnibacterium sp.]|uniref:GAF domain-containing protein n=1 Tax=uncultured Amnibacterium sp. TaxID=1631851 RepID=UPI0035CB7AFB